MELRPSGSDAPRQGPDHDFAGTHPSQDPSNGIGGCSRGEDVVDHDPSGVGQPLFLDRLEGAADVGSPFFPGQAGLRRGGFDPPDQIGPDGYPQRSPEESGETLGLIEFTLALADGMQRNGDDPVPRLIGEVGLGEGNPEFPEEGFEPEGAMVLVEMDGIAGDALGLDGRAGTTEGQVPADAVRTFKTSRDLARERQPASVAGGLANRDDRGPASVADQPLGRAGMRLMTDLTALRIEEGKQGINAGMDGCTNHVGSARVRGRRAT